jgi:hypothetical protein
MAASTRTEAIMETLLDYIFETKKLSYLVAVILMVGAIPFWRFLIEREEHDDEGIGARTESGRSA